MNWFCLSLSLFTVSCILAVAFRPNFRTKRPFLVSHSMFQLGSKDRISVDHLHMLKVYMTISVRKLPTSEWLNV